MLRTQIMLTPTIKYQAQVLAQEENVSLSALVREALLSFISRKGGAKDNSALFLQMAKEAKNLSVKPSVPSDLASNDNYLYSPKAHYEGFN